MVRVRRGLLLAMQRDGEMQHSSLLLFSLYVMDGSELDSSCTGLVWIESQN